MTVVETAIGERAFTAVTGSWTGDDAKALKKSGAQELWLNYADGFDEPSLELLTELPETVSRLRIIARWMTDLEPIYSLSGHLRELTLTTAQKTTLDLERLPQLTKISAEWPQV